MACFTYGSLRFHYLDFPIDLLDPDIQNNTKQYKEVHPQASPKEVQANEDAYIPGMLERTYKKCAVAYYQENIRRRKLHFFLNIISLLNVVATITFYVWSFFLQNF